MHPDRRLETDEDNPWLWTRFVGAVWEALGKGAARDVVSLRKVCERLWLPFVAHIRDGTYGTRDFSRLMVRTRGLFQGEGGLARGLVNASTSASTLAGGQEGRKRSAKGMLRFYSHSAHLRHSSNAFLTSPLHLHLTANHPQPLMTSLTTPPTS